MSVISILKHSQNYLFIGIFKIQKILTYSLGYHNMLHIHNQRDKLYDFFLHLLLLNVFKHLIILAGNSPLYMVTHKN